MKFLEILNKIAKLGYKDKIRVVAASKYVDFNAIKDFYNQGLKDFGENKIQDLLIKQKQLEDCEISWHFIGNLQTNKINQMIKAKPVLWQSCNSFELALAVDKRLDYKLDTLIEINIANEDTKNGLDADKAIEIYQKIIQNCKNLNLIGVMSIGLHSNDINLIAKSFENTYKIYQDLQKFGAKICSMGMSGDYEIAIKSGSNMIRLGSILFK